MQPVPLVDLSQEERFQQIAAILSQGVLRHLQRLKRSQNSISEIPSKTSPDGLELCSETRLTVSQRSGG
jgi:hypothetical protein